jgi:hypothetical protein
MISKPDHDGIAILYRCLTKPEQRPNLGAMILDRAAIPVIVRPAFWTHLGLPHEIFDRRGGYLIAAAWKSAFRLKELQQSRETDPARAALVYEQHKLAGRKRPLLDHLILCTDLFHGQCRKSPKFREEPRTLVKWANLASRKYLA